jgi:predicted GNAT superfamily acetyltransferase
MRDTLNAGLASDRFQVEWWVNTNRVRKRISKNPKPPLDLAHYLAAGVKIVNPSRLNEAGLPLPMTLTSANDLKVETTGKRDPILLLEIPADFQTLRSMDISLAGEWRKHTRLVFEYLFQVGYIVTDFVHLSGNSPRSFYVLVHGESTL